MLCICRPCFKKAFQKNIYFCFIDYAKAFDCVEHNKLWKILKRDGNTRPPYLPPSKPVCRSTYSAWVSLVDWAVPMGTGMDEGEEAGGGV